MMMMEEVDFVMSTDDHRVRGASTVEQSRKEQCGPVRFQTLHQKETGSTDDAVRLVLLALIIDGTGSLGETVGVQLLAAAPANFELTADDAFTDEP